MSRAKILLGKPASIYEKLRQKIKSKLNYELPEFSVSAVWVLAFIFCTCLFVAYQLIPLHDEYIYENVVTSSQVVASDTFPTPRISLYLPHYYQENKRHRNLHKLCQMLYDNHTNIDGELMEIRHDLTANNFDVWRAINISQRKPSNVDDFCGNITALFVRKLLDEMENNAFDLAAFLQEGWSDPIGDAVLELFMQNSEMDKGITVGEGTSVADLIVLEKENWKLKQLFENVVGTIVCRQLEFWHWFGDEEAYMNCTELFQQHYETGPPVLNARGLWLPLPISHKPAKQKARFSIAYYPKSLFFTTASAPEPFQFFLGTTIRHAESDFGSIPLYLIPSPRNGHGTKLQLRYAVDKLFKDRRQQPKCVDQSSRAVCQVHCYNNWFYKNCGCFPLTSGQTSGPYCTSSLYASCAKAGNGSLRSRVLVACKTLCAQLCDEAFYTWNAKLEMEKIERDVVELEFGPEFSPFEESVLTQKITFPLLFAMLLSSFSTWFGLSGIGLFKSVIDSAIKGIRFLIQGQKKQEVIQDTITLSPIATNERNGTDVHSTADLTSSMLLTFSSIEALIARLDRMESRQEQIENIVHSLADQVPLVVNPHRLQDAASEPSNVNGSDGTTSPVEIVSVESVFTTEASAVTHHRIDDCPSRNVTLASISDDR